MSRVAVMERMHARRSGTVATATRQLRMLAGAARQVLHSGRAGDTAVVLAYHDVVDGPASGLSVSLHQLNAHLGLLGRLGFRVVALDEMVAAWEHATSTGASLGRLAAITFDDALVGVHHHALDVLQAHRAPATIFAVSGCLGTEPPWWPGSARTMTKRELVEAAARPGITVASHTHSHPSLPSLNEAQLQRELTDSRGELEDLLGRLVETVAYPYGHHNAVVRAATAAAGYRAGFTFLNGRLTGREDRYRLPRLTMVAATAQWRVGLQLCRTAASWPDHQAGEVLEGGPA